MSRILKILITAILISLGPASVARAAEVILVPFHQVVAVGDTFSVDIAISLEEGEELAGGVMALRYDGGVAEILEVTIDPYWDFKPDPGEKTGVGLWEKIGFDVFQNTPVTNTAVIASVTLEARAVGTSQLAVLDTSQFFSATAQFYPKLTEATILVNTPPVAYDQAVITDEDTAVSITLTGSDFDGDALTYAVVTNPANGTLSGTAPDLAYTPNVNFSGGDSFTFQVNDGKVDSNTATVSITVSAVNDAPVVNAGADQAADEGAAVTFAGSFEDPGANSHTIQWNFGDGATATGSLTPTHIYTHNGIYTVTLTVMDDDDGIGSDSLKVTVYNVEPSVAAGPDQAVADGTAVTFAGSFTDPGTDSHTVQWNFGDGTNAAGTLIPTHIYADRGVYAVTLTVMDDDDGIGRDTLTVTVVNVTPIANAGDDQAADEGANVTFVGSFEDPGTDSHTIQWNFGDGATATGTLAPTHTYSDNGIYTVTLTVTDDHGAVGADTLTVTVSNVAPMISELGADEIIEAGETMFAACSFSDPGDDTWTAEIDFGDGVQETLALDRNKSFTFSHTYSSVGLHTVLIMIFDQDGGEDAADLIVAVTGDSDCSRGKGFWAHQFSDNGKHQIDDATLQAYLYIIDRFSSVFSENISMTTIEEAKLVFWPAGGGNGKKDKDLAKKEQALDFLLATWLNFADGAFSLVTPVDTDFDNVPDMTFAEAIQWVESILNNPDSDTADFILAKDICESINNMGDCN